MSRRRRILLFLKHKCLVTLTNKSISNVSSMRKLLEWILLPQYNLPQKKCKSIVPIFIDLSTMKLGDNVLGSVCPSVCLSRLSQLNRWTFHLDVWHGLDFDLGQAVIVGQGRRSKFKVNCQKSCFDITVTSLQDQGRGQGQCQGQRSNFWCTVVDIKGSALSVISSELHFSRISENTAKFPRNPRLPRHLGLTRNSILTRNPRISEVDRILAYSRNMQFVGYPVNCIFLESPRIPLTFRDLRDFKEIQDSREIRD